MVVLSTMTAMATLSAQSVHHFFWWWIIAARHWLSLSFSDSLPERTSLSSKESIEKCRNTTQNPKANTFEVYGQVNFWKCLSVLFTTEIWDLEPLDEKSVNWKSKRISTLNLYIESLREFSKRFEWVKISFCIIAREKPLRILLGSSRID